LLVISSEQLEEIVTTMSALISTSKIHTRFELAAIPQANIRNVGPLSLGSGTLRLKKPWSTPTGLICTSGDR
jgi:hypothetical protein